MSSCKSELILFRTREALAPYILRSELLLTEECTAQIRFGYGSDISLLQINFLFSFGIFPNFMLLCYQLNFNTKNTLWERVRKRLCIAVRKKNKLRKCC